MKITPQKADVNKHFEGHCQDFFSYYGEIKSSAGLYHKIVCPFHPDSDPSLSFRSDTGLWKCFGCKKAGDIFKFYGLIKGISSFPEILQGICQDFNIPMSGDGSGSSKSAGKSSQKSKIVKTYDYTDEKGDLLFQVVRFDPKDFKQRRPDGQGGWVWNMDGVQRVLYQLPEVLQMDLILFVEGEKDCNNLRKKGFAATTVPGGAEKWLEAYGETLSGRDVVLLPDNDEPGRRHIEKVARSLKDVARSIKILELPGLPYKGDVSDWIEAGGTKEELEKMISECPPWEPEEDPEETVNSLYPRGPFPWDVLPPAIADSLKQLARACASSPTSLPGAAVSIFASVIGSTVSVSPKRSWTEPLIFWFGDIRPSGSGKTPAARSLCRVLYEAQSKADEAYKAAMEEWEATPKKEQGKPPAMPRGYFVTSLTLEGLRTDHSGHGGSVCVLDELSSFLSSQNEYKKKGSDRESWLCLHDGNPARIVRAGKSLTLNGSRVSIFGGVQPGVWRKSFSGEEGEIYLIDGTIYRFLPTFEGEAFYLLTAEAWSDENRKEWEDLLKAAMKWANRQQTDKKKKVLCLDRDAKQAFLDWRNELMQVKEDLPGQVRGFIPKLVGYALRFAGVLYLMDVFSRGQEPRSILNVDDIRKGIRVSEFHLGHIIKAMDAIVSEDIAEVFEVTEQVIHLARTLAGLKGDLDNGRLAVGYIQGRFDAGIEREMRVHNSRFMGSLLRKCGLTITGGRYRANGKTGVYCLVWDKKTDSFIEKTSTSPSSPQNGIQSGSKVMEEENPMSIKSITEDQAMDEMMDMMEEGKPMSIRQEPHLERVCGHDGGDGGVFLNESEKEEAPEFIEI